jgi:hypothetical protein
LLGETQFQERLKKCEHGFCSLVLIRPVGMETVTAASCCRIIQWLLEIVPSEKPFKCPSRFFDPLFVSGVPEGLKTRRDRCLRFHRLLIEAGAFVPMLIEAVRTYRDKMPFA